MHEPERTNAELLDYLIDLVKAPLRQPTADLETFNSIARDSFGSPPVESCHRINRIPIKLSESTFHRDAHSRIPSLPGEEADRPSDI